MRQFFRVLGFAAGVVLIVGACSGDETPARSVLAAGCSINSDCNDPLVCAFQRCHNACESSRDCPEGQRCLASDRPFHVCQLSVERDCTYTSDCPELQVCGSDGQCRDQCRADGDCVTGQVCVSGSCAEPRELDGGKLPSRKIDSGAAPPPTGQPCSYNSECSEPLVCRNGLCAYECRADIDCRSGQQCVDRRCTGSVAVPTGAPVEWGNICSYNSECGASLVCRAGACAYDCLASSDCASGEACVSNFCRSLLPDGGVAPADAGTVVPPGAPPDWGTRCSYNSQCTSPLVCRGGACAYDCLGDADCAVGERCTANRCSGGPVTQPDSGTTVPPGAPPGWGKRCAYNSECAASLICRTGACAYECVGSADCSGGDRCVANRCRPLPPEGGTTSPNDAGLPPGWGNACSYNSQCGSPLICRGGECAYECLGDKDCPANERCTGNLCVTAPPTRIDAGTSTPDGGSPDASGPGCVPKSCVALSKNCGLIDDGCGQTFCGTCPTGQECGAGGIPNVCAPGSCQPKSCDAQGKNCGMISDGCAWQLQCGSCTAPQACGGAGSPNVCGCTPNLVAACAGKDCGTVVTNCGTTTSCGTCTAPNTCAGAGTPNVCGCTKTTCIAQNKNCGLIPDGCGGLLDCGPCTSGYCGGGPLAGGAGTPNVCGPAVCVATDCTTLGKNCGIASDGCGGTLDCGSCTAPNTCGGSGTANVCGCTKTTCSAQNKNCDNIPDGCGGVLPCGGCSSPLTCGGGGQQNVCGCTPTSCAAQNKNCGTMSNGCGGLLTCGTCTSPEVCGGGGIPNVCAVSLRPPSCVGGGLGAGFTCGSSNDDCCSSILLPAGSFNRSNNASYPGSVHDFRLDRYAVTVGRFRAFLNSGHGTQQGPPPDWAGGQPFIANSGWNPAWKSNLVADLATLTSRFRDNNHCWNGSGYGTWTNVAAQSDNNPMNCATFFEAVAFCAWDNAWLVTEVEYNYAQAGGSEQRLYPWSVPPGSNTIDITYTNAYSLTGTPNYPVSVGSKSPKGDGKWGHSDLVGNMGQLLMDVWNSPYFFTSCADCAYLGTVSTERVIRGGSWNESPWNNTSRSSISQSARDARVGFRCARLP